MNLKNIIWIIILVSCITFVKADCNETWIYNDTGCDGFNYTIQYYDLNNCNTSINVPIDNSSIIDCQCYPYWHKSIESCLNGVTPILYTDENNCNVTSSLPLDNGTNEYCVLQNQEIYTDDVIILIVLFIFLVISTVLAITIHEAFFGLNALLSALITTTFIIYKYPLMLIGIMPIIIIMFASMWLLLYKHKR